MKFTIIAAIFLFVISVLHVLRIVFGVEVLINNWPVPFWLNGIAAVVTAGLAILLLKENK